MKYPKTPVVATDPWPWSPEMKWQVFVDVQGSRMWVVGPTKFAALRKAVFEYRQFNVNRAIAALKS